MQRTRYKNGLLAKPKMSFTGVNYGGKERWTRGVLEPIMLLSKFQDKQWSPQVNGFEAVSQFEFY